jgi:hypothetical protein
MFAVASEDGHGDVKVLSQAHSLFSMLDSETAPT